MTQHETIKWVLSGGEYVCGTRFLDLHIPEYRTRINELRKAGIEIETRPCKQHNHKSKNLQEWRIPQRTYEVNLFPAKT